MKKLLIILLGTFAFACGNTDNDAGNINGDATTIDESVDKGAGEEISPQLKFESDSNENFEVDTVTSAESIEQQIE